MGAPKPVPVRVERRRDTVKARATEGPLVFARGERDRNVSLFTEAAVQLFGQCAVLLGWRADEFWDATPAELACVLSAMTAQTETPPDASDLQTLMELFPDAPTGGD